MKRISTDFSDFNEIIDRSYLYADKTKYIYDLLTSDSSNYFLSRPRRFGKSLLISTLSDLFTNGGNRFKDLWIGGSDYQFETRPVVYLSLFQESSTPEMLAKNILVDLSRIASEAGLGPIQAETPAKYFQVLIEELHKAAGQQVAVLIDEYDFPVTRRTDDLETAKANARILHDFFGVLKIKTVSESIRFTLVTGITRHALTSMDSGGNHLTDISLDPKYAGICGITVDEFGGLFADRMDAALARLKETGDMEEAATIEDLKALVFKWYDGYDWGGGVRVLNPFSILNFFKHHDLRDYWVTSGRPGHLTAMIEAHPENFVASRWKTYTSEALRKTELTQLEPVPVLFHSGYLTLDEERRKAVLAEKAELAGGRNKVDSNFYCFRTPNYEVNNSLNKTLFKTIFKSDPKESSLAGELRVALLDKDAEKVGQLFIGQFSRVSYHQRPSDEGTFHSLVQVMLSAMEFEVQSEVPGAAGRLDLTLALPNEVRVIIELKYVKHELTEAESNKAMAEMAATELEPELRHKLLARAVVSKFGLADQRLSGILGAGLTLAEQNQKLAEEAMRLLPKATLYKVLADQVKAALPPEVIEEALKAKLIESTPSGEQIDSKLLKVAQKALNDINYRKYETIMSGISKEIIKLGLAGFGNLTHIKAFFG